MIVLVGGEKGGVGKTTLAVNLAAMRRRAGHDVLLVDADRQASANLWGIIARFVSRFTLSGITWLYGFRAAF